MIWIDTPWAHFQCKKILFKQDYIFKKVASVGLLFLNDEGDKKTDIVKVKGVGWR